MALSPVIMTVRMPIARIASKRSRMPSLTTSFRWMTPSSRAGSAPTCSATTSGVPPVALTFSTRASSSSESLPPVLCTHFVTAELAPLRTTRSGRSMPLIRVVAEKCISEAPSGSRSTDRPPCVSTRSTMLRPSGVSSANDASRDASAIRSASTPASGSSSVARRLPCVMVPVLSSRSTSTSPAASTARPDMASTLRRTRRSIPAIPIADSRAPMVVGIRQTSSAVRTTIDWPAWLYLAKGYSVTTTTTKMTVSATSSTLSAISLGCAAAPTPPPVRSSGPRRSGPARR